MRSFTLSVFASLAFGLFCSAAPTPADLPPVPADVPAVPTNTKSLTDILGDLAATVGPIKDQIPDLNTPNGVEDTVTTTLGIVMNALDFAVGDLEGLQQSLGEVTTDVSLDLDTIAGHLADVLEVVVPLVLKLVTGTVDERVLPLVQKICDLVGKLLGLVIFFVGQAVIPPLLALVANLLPFIGDAYFATMAAALGIQS